VSTAALVIGLLAVLASGGVGAFLIMNRGASGAGTAAPTSPAPSGASPSVIPSASASPRPTAPPTFAATGPGTFVYAGGQSPVMGTAGTLRKYRVAIETGTPVPVDEFAAAVDRILGDPRSWIAGRNVRLQRIPGGASGYNFTVYLVTPGTAYTRCKAGGYDIFWRGEPYTSCRVGGQVLINIARWLRGTPDYGAPLETYQEYAVNHEVGHALGHGHELCPGSGRPAPVMQQQTFDLQGCTAYSWPYLNGRRHAGPPGRIVPPD
jgi:hypothetical protein